MIAAFQGWLRDAGAWALIPIFLIIVLESSAFLGLLFPGEVAALIAGALAAAEAFTPIAAFLTVAGGAIAGDIFGYALGRFYGRAVLARWPFARRTYDQHRARIESYFERWGSATVLIARFIAVGRAFAPFAAGLSEMPARRFVPMAVVSGVLWSGVLVTLGFLLGSNWHIVEIWMRSLGAGIFIIFVFTVGMAAFWRWLSRRQDEITAAGRRIASRYGIDLDPVVEFISARLSPRGYLGLHFTVGLLAVVAMAWLFGGVAQDIFAQDPLVHVDRAVATLIANHRTSDLDFFVMMADFLGNLFWLAAIVGLAAAALAWIGDFAAAITAALALAGAYALAHVLQVHFSGLSPHVPAANLIHGFQGFPSITLASVTAAYGIAGHTVIARTANWRVKTLAVVAGFYLVVLVGLGALYRGVLLSATIAGFALGGCWLAVCVTGRMAYERLRAL